MKGKITLNLLLALGLILALGAGSSLAQEAAPSGPAGIDAVLGTAFTYQGRLTQSGAPMTGSCDFQFSLWDAATGGAQIGATQTKTGVAVEKGYFTVALDFGATAFNGEARYLAISVICGADFATLTPRTLLTPAPYALALPGLRTEQNATSPNLIGGYSGNSVTAGVVGAAIGGGGEAGHINQVNTSIGTPGNYCTIGGGVGNTVGGYGSVIGGGVGNQAGNYAATVAGGENNTATGLNATVAGGFGNTASNSTDTVSGGVNNTASGGGATVGGGGLNTASGLYSYAAGYRAKASHQGAFVWADSTDADFASTVNNQFAVRANGGVVFSTGSAPVQVNGNTVWHVGNDGSSSGLDADLLDGYHAGNTSFSVPLNNATLNTNLNADFLDGQHGSYYQNASNINAGALGAAYYSAYADLNAEGYLDNNAASDLLTRAQGDGRYWALGGNAVGAEQVLGTTDNYALDIRVNNNRALRLEPNATSPNVIGGHSGNNVWTGAYGATIGGGGLVSTPNRVTDAGGTVGGGANNRAGDAAGLTNDRTYSTVAGGLSNVASGEGATVGGGRENAAGGGHATVGGGRTNVADGAGATVGGGGWDGSIVYSNMARAPASTISGGLGNNISDGGTNASIGGGRGNAVEAAAATISGGSGNYITDAAYDATIGGGSGNRIDSSAATISGGSSNQISTSASNAAIGGGKQNIASAMETFIGGGIGNQANVDRAAVVGGYHNIASANVAFVGGGASNVASGPYSVVPGGNGNTAAGNVSLAAGNRAKANAAGCFVWGDSTAADVTCSTANQTIFRSTGGFYVYTNSGLTSGMYMAAGGSAWNIVSNRALKENFAPVDTAALLDRLAAIEISTWNYKAQDPAIRHVGPMADEFNALLDGLGGEGADHVNSLDADGVALAAAQGLYRLAQEQAASLSRLEQENARLRAENAAQDARLNELIARVRALEEGRR